MTSLNKKPIPIVGVSACLTGEAVRYDGAHKLQPLIFRCLNPFVQLQIVCPEVSAGLGAPRPPIALQQQLQQRKQDVRALVVDGRIPAKDVSDELTKVAVQFLNNFYRQPLCGFIFKSRSPSCGLGSTPIAHRNEANGNQRVGNGLFAEQLSQSKNYRVLIEETWLANEERYFRFLTACYLVFHHFYDGPIDQELLALLKLTAAQAQEERAVIECIENLISENDKAAHGERLCEYWNARREAPT